MSGMREPGFRLAQSEDCAVLLEMMRQFYALDAYPFEVETARTALEALLGNRSLGQVWLITWGGESIGYLVLTFGYSLEYGGRDAFVDELFILAPYRRRGVGTRAMEFAAAQCKDLDIRALHLEVEHGNLAGQALYRKAGFVNHDRLLMTRTIG